MTIQVMTSEHGWSRLECSCDHTAVRQRTLSNGVLIYALQCLDCGRQIRAVSKNAPEVLEMPSRMPFDEHLKERWRQRQQEHYDTQRASREQRQQDHDTEWWQRYNAYLLTPAWRAKRAAVLARANGTCEGCAQRLATQVHHTTYAHVGNELLFELVAVCDTCHHILHPEMD